MREKLETGTSKATKGANGAATAKPARQTTPRAAASRSAVRKGTRAVAPTADVQAQIRQRAYELWERDGRPDGRDYAHWAEAEREIGATRSTA